MSEFNYEHGRLNLPFVGHCTFAKAPPCIDWDAIDADIAVLGVPNDMGTQYRPEQGSAHAAFAKLQHCSRLDTAAPTT